MTARIFGKDRPDIPADRSLRLNAIDPRAIRLTRHLPFTHFPPDYSGQQLNAQYLRVPSVTRPKPPFQKVPREWESRVQEVVST